MVSQRHQLAKELRQARLSKGNQHVGEALSTTGTLHS